MAKKCGISCIFQDLVTQYGATHTQIDRAAVPISPPCHTGKLYLMLNQGCLQLRYERDRVVWLSEQLLLQQPLSLSAVSW